MYSLTVDIMHQADCAATVETVVEICERNTNSAIIMLVVKGVNVGTDTVLDPRQ